MFFIGAGIGGDYNVWQSTDVRVNHEEDLTWGPFLDYLGICVRNDIEEIQICTCVSYHTSILLWCRQCFVKSFSMENKSPFVLHSRYYDWPGDARRQGMSRHGMDLGLITTKIKRKVYKT